ncbi:hypothetical protein K1W54_27345 [Micromonospora sp. CPCC 205371]|nr:hypothetical protein [Micromonospora sp. CPCC 205371]
MSNHRSVLGSSLVTAALVLATVGVAQSSAAAATAGRGHSRTRSDQRL